MQDFKTAYLTCTSPKAMFLSQVIGTTLGCVTSPLSFFLFYKAFDVGNPNGEFKAPFALMYRNMAILGVQGFSALPEHCLQICYYFSSEGREIYATSDGHGYAFSSWVILCHWYVYWKFDCVCVAQAQLQEGWVYGFCNCFWINLWRRALNTSSCCSSFGQSKSSHLHEIFAFLGTISVGLANRNIWCKVISTEIVQFQGAKKRKKWHIN